MLWRGYSHQTAGDGTKEGGVNGGGDLTRGRSGRRYVLDWKIVSNKLIKGAVRGSCHNLHHYKCS